MSRHLCICPHTTWRSSAQGLLVASHGGGPRRRMPAPGPVTHLVYSGLCGRVYAVSEAVGEAGVYVFEEETGELLGRVEVGGSVIEGLAVDDGRGVLYGKVGEGVGVWGLRDGRWKGFMEGGGVEAPDGAEGAEEGRAGREGVMYVDGKYLYTASNRRGVWVFDLDERAAVREISMIDGIITALVRVDEQLWVGRKDGMIAVYDVFGQVEEGIECVTKVRMGDGRITALLYLGAKYVYVGVGRTVCVVDAETFKVVESLEVKSQVEGLKEISRIPFDRVTLMAAGFHEDRTRKITRDVPLTGGMSVAGLEHLLQIGKSERVVDSKVIDEENSSAAANADLQDQIMSLHSQWNESTIPHDTESSATGDSVRIKPSVAGALHINLHRMARLLDVVEGESVGDAEGRTQQQQLEKLRKEVQVARELLNLCTVSCSTERIRDDHLTEKDQREEIRLTKSDGAKEKLRAEQVIKGLQRERDEAIRERNEVVQEMEILRSECDATVTSLERVMREIAAKADESAKKEKMNRSSLARQCDVILSQAAEVGQEATRLETVIKEAEQAKQELETVRKEKEKANAQVVALKDKIESNERQAKEQAEETTKKLREAERREHGLKKDIEKLEERQKVLDEVILERDQAKTAVEDLTAKLRTAEQNTAEYLLEEKKEKAGLMAERDAVKKDLEAFTKENELVKGTVKALEEKLDTISKSKEKLQQALELAKVSLAQKEAALEAKVKECDKLVKELESSRLSIGALQGEKRSLTSQVDDGERDLKKERAQVQQLKGQVQALEEREQELSHLVEDSSKKLSQANLEKKEVEKEFIELKSSLAMSRQNYETVVEKNTEAIEKADNLLSERNDLKLQCEKLSSQLRGSEESVVELMKELEVLKTGKEEAVGTDSPAHNAASEKLGTSLSDRQRQLDELTSQLSEVRAEKTKSEELVTSLKEDIRNLRKEREQEKAAYEKSLVDIRFECQQSEGRLRALLNETERVKLERSKAAEQLSALEKNLAAVSRQSEELEERLALRQRELDAQTEALIALSRSATESDTERNRLQARIQELELERNSVEGQTVPTQSNAADGAQSKAVVAAARDRSQIHDAQLKKALESAKQDMLATEVELKRLSGVTRRYRKTARAHKDSLPILVELDKELRRIGMENSPSQLHILRASNVVADVISCYFSEDDRRSSNAEGDRYSPSPFRRAAIAGTLSAWKGQQGSAESSRNHPSGEGRAPSPSAEARRSLFPSWTPGQPLRS